ncbi:hypothetical protein [Roseimaritima sediminicola]|uniref:hypothetical protein n=1 Tax=Roseimaritima sediminicola TaxID=2662066 RepID=UPI0012983BAF|nr:hypothetical protein [Roseimaritima sediminicola]
MSTRSCCDRSGSGDHQQAGDQAAHEESTVGGHAAVAASESVPGVQANCLCGVDGEPAVPPSPRAPSSEQRDLPLVAMLDASDLAGAILVPRPRPDLCAGIGSSYDHFGQRLLCSWRL